MGFNEVLVHIDNGVPLVWNADDVMILRKMYRIVGTLIGCNAEKAFQNTALGLPLQLLPEQVTLLLQQGVVSVVASNRLKSSASLEDRNKYESYLRSSYQCQNEKYKEIRKKSLIEMSDEIIAGYARKRSGVSLSKRQMRKRKIKPEDVDAAADAKQRELVHFDDEEKKQILDGLIEKIADIPQSSCLRHIPTESPWLKEKDLVEADWKFPETAADKLRCKVFHDLWQKKYYITQATSFGGDFLVYPGDPMQFHAMYIAICVDQHENSLDGKSLTYFGRMGNNVRKTTVLCSLNDGDQVEYISLNFSSFKL